MGGPEGEDGDDDLHPFNFANNDQQDASSVEQDHTVPANCSNVIDNLCTQREAHLVDGGYEQRSISDQLSAKLKLMVALQKINALIGTFDVMYKWAQSLQDQNIKLSSSCTRDSVIKELTDQYDLSGLKPKTNFHVLPGSKERVKITTHDFLQVLYLMLTDPALMTDKNLLLNKDDDGRPFGEPHWQR